MINNPINLYSKALLGAMAEEQDACIFYALNPYKHPVPKSVLREQELTRLRKPHHWYQYFLKWLIEEYCIKWGEYFYDISRELGYYYD